MQLSSLKDLKQLPNVLGTYRYDYPLYKLAWFKVGGAADLIFIPSDLNDLKTFLKELPANIKITLIGACSNLLIRDGGIADVVIKLGKGFTFINKEEDNLVVGAGALDIVVSKYAQKNNIKGFVFKPAAKIVPSITPITTNTP